MIEGVDYSYDPPAAVTLYASGKRFAASYVGPGSLNKLFSADEIARLVRAGLAIVSLVEGGAASALEGYATGQSHARLALAASARLHMPDDRPFYFAVDFDPTAGQWAHITDYLHGAASVVGWHRVGVYGGIRTVAWAAANTPVVWFFQTYAWSNGKWYAGNHIEQYHNGVVLAGGTVDLCRARRSDYGQWVPTGPPADNGGDMAEQLSTSEQTALAVAYQGAHALVHGEDNTPGGLNQAGGEPVWLVAQVKAIKAALDGETIVDLTPLAERLDNILAAVTDIEQAPAVDAVAVAHALAESTDFTQTIAAAVAAQLADIHGEITLSGALTGSVRPPA